MAAAGTWAALFVAADFAANDNFYLYLLIPGYRTVELMPVTGMFLASGLAAVLVSLVTPKPGAATLAKFYGEGA